MDTILKKANCSSGETFNTEIVAKIMHVLLNMSVVDDNGGLYKKLDIKFKTLKSEFFTSSRFADINHWSLQNTAVYTYAKYNMAVYTMLWGGAYTCPFKTITPDKNNLDNNYDGYDFGSQDVIIYNISTKEYVIMNTWHIHAIYYHNNFGNEKYKLDIKKLSSVVGLVNVSKINITVKNELVYDNILTLAHNQASYLMDHKPIIKLVGDLIIMSALLKENGQHKKYESFKASAFKKKSGNLLFSHNFLHIAFLRKTEVIGKAINPKIVNLPNSERSEVIKHIYQTYGIKLVMDEGLYKYNLVNECYPIMKDMHYYDIE